MLAAHKKHFQERNPWSHKGDFGKLLIIGGSRRYTGSPALAALAALHTGVDLTLVAAPERAANVIAGFSPDLITEPLAGDAIMPFHLDLLLSLAEKYDAVVIGGGLGTNPATFKLVDMFLEKTNKPCVVDADAIKALEGCRKKLKQNFILTPHPGEFKILTGVTPSMDLAERGNQTKDAAKTLNCVVLLKGHIDFISDGNKIVSNDTGSVYMTKGGTGDTLAGICGALLAKKTDPMTAAVVGAYINGKAGELAAAKLGPGMLASDLIEMIPSALK
jgi:NAD(P)H-hydrate epimerase